MFPFIRIQIAGQRNITIKMDTIKYIEKITHNLSTEYASHGTINEQEKSI